MQPQISLNRPLWRAHLREVAYERDNLSGVKFPGIMYPAPQRCFRDQKASIHQFLD